jgi:membrane dipeptidase
MWLAVLAVAALAAEIQADLHLDTPTQLHRNGVGLDAPSGLEAGLGALRAGGTNVAVEVLWPPRNAKDPSAHVDLLLGLVEENDRRLDDVSIARTPAEARAIAGAGGVALVLALEGAQGLDGPTPGDWRLRLSALEARGLQIVGLTWSFSNRFAGSSGDSGQGLTDEGTALVAQLAKDGVIVDLSHASRATTLEVCGASKVPVIASHSDSYTLHAHARNLTDDEIRCIAATGGVIGVNFHATFVGGTRDVKAVADQADAIARIGGFASVALGSDFDGIIKVPTGLEDASRLPALWAELRARGWTDAQIRGMRGENFLRVWEAVEHAATQAER